MSTISTQVQHYTSNANHDRPTSLVNGDTSYRPTLQYPRFDAICVRDHQEHLHPSHLHQNAYMSGTEEPNLESDIATRNHPAPSHSLDIVVAQSAPSKFSHIWKWCTGWQDDWWWLEIISLILSTIFTSIIVIVLCKMDGQPMAAWKNGLSIDALLSILTGLSKACLLMPISEALGQIQWIWSSKEKNKRASKYEALERASRGKWGAIAVLASTRGVTLASIGAAILLLSVPLDLFYQQIVSFPTIIRVDQSINTTISRAILYDPDPDFQYRDGDTSIPEDALLQAFTKPYWRSTGLSPGVDLRCPTSNCTYDPFDTLAIDFRCGKLPVDLLEFGCKNTSAEWLSTVVLDNPGSNPNVSSCGWYLQPPYADMPQLMSGYEMIADASIGEVLTTRFYPLTDVLTQRMYNNGSINFPDVKHPIVDFILVSTPGGFEGATSNTTPTVTECEAHWVVKRLQAKVVKNVLTEETVDTFEFHDNLDPALTWNQNHTIYNANFTMTLPDPHSFTGDTSTYGLSNITAYKVWQVWASLAPSAFTRPVKNNPANSGPVLKTMYPPNSSPHLSQVLDPALPWDTPANVSDHMAQVINTMNQVLRRNTASERKRHDVCVGSAYYTTVIVSIRWQWIAFPIALWLFALSFLAATMLRGRGWRKQQHPHRRPETSDLEELQTCSERPKLSDTIAWSTNKQAQTRSLQVSRTW